MTARKKAAKADVAKGIAAATAATPSEPTAPLDPRSSELNSFYKMKPDGLYKITYVKGKDGEPPEPKPEKICPPFEVLGTIRDREGNSHGLRLSWLDAEGKRHHADVLKRLLIINGETAIAPLADGGLDIRATRHTKACLIDYLSTYRTSKFIRSVDQIGWHRDGSKPVFVLPSITLGRSSEEVIFATEQNAPDPFGSAGTLKDWRDNIASQAQGNPRLALAIAFSLSGPLLALVDVDGAGIHLVGKAKTGKTTAGVIGASVWGGTPARGAAGFKNGWRATANGLEGIAASRNDTFLLLDEINEADSKEVKPVIYMLSNGEGKIRGMRSGTGARPVLSFRLNYMSTGEKSVAEIIRQGGGTINAGQDVRLITLSAYQGAGMGIFGNLLDCQSPDAFAQRLKERTGLFYGTAGPAFINHLIDRLSRGAVQFEDELRARVKELCDTWLSGRQDVAGQVISVARSFALAAVAGELATRAGILGWEPAVAADHIGLCFKDWLAARGHVGQSETRGVVTQLLDFLGKHGQSRFEIWQTKPRKGEPDDPNPPPEPGDPKPPHEPRAIFNRAGFRRSVIDNGNDGQWHYYVLGEGLREALAGHEFDDALDTLIALGYLGPRNPRTNVASRSLAVNGGKYRLYAIHPAIFDFDGEAG